MRKIAQSGQQFAYRYLHTRAKAMYARQAIIEYNKLFEVCLQLDRIPFLRARLLFPCKFIHYCAL